MKRLLITGAAGGLGSMARTHMKHMADVLRISDNVDLGDTAPNEEAVICDLTDGDAVNELVSGCDGIVHFGGRSLEDTWEVIRGANIDGVYNLYEAARNNNRPRILFASSNHVVGYHLQSTKIGADAPLRPDGLYGVSKVFGEGMARMYYDKFGIETACLRIGSCFPEPQNHRMLSTWMSFADMVRLVECVFRVPNLGCPVIYGVSDNDACWWDNSSVSYIGWSPQDNAETFRAKLDASMEPPASDAPDAVYQGGMFTANGIFK